MKIGIFLMVVVWFGLPFLSLTDLFPMHRFGMFARPPRKPAAIMNCRLEQKLNHKPWTELKTGNAYLDESYLPAWTLKALDDSATVHKLVHTARFVSKEEVDSLRIVFETGGKQQYKVLFPY